MVRKARQLHNHGVLGERMQYEASADHSTYTRRFGPYALRMLRRYHQDGSFFVQMLVRMEEVDSYRIMSRRLIGRFLY